MTHENQWVWSALEALADLEQQRDEAQAGVTQLSERIASEYDRIQSATGQAPGSTAATLRMIRACGSPLDIHNPREPSDPLAIPPFLDRTGSDEGDPD